MNSMAKSTNDIHKKIKQKNMMKLEKQNQNKKNEDGEVEMKLK